MANQRLWIWTLEPSRPNQTKPNQTMPNHEIGWLKIDWIKWLQKYLQNIWHNLGCVRLSGRVALLKWLTYTIRTGLHCNCWLLKICEGLNYISGRLEPNWPLQPGVEKANLQHRCNLDLWNFTSCPATFGWLLQIWVGEKAMGRGAACTAHAQNSTSNRKIIWGGKPRWGEAWTRKLT